MYVVAMKKKSFDVVEYPKVTKIEEKTIETVPVLQLTVTGVTDPVNVNKRNYNVAILFDGMDEI